VTRKKNDGVNLPNAVPEDGYPAGDGPAWISHALGAPGCLEDVERFYSDDGEEAALVLRFANGREQVFRPARIVTTRRLSEVLGALGFPVPYYSPPQLARLGQAIGRVADRHQAQDEDSIAVEYASLVAGWAVDCLRSNVAFVLRGRKGRDVRAAIEHVHRGYVAGSPTVPSIVEPERKVLLAWTVPVRRVIRDRLGTASDGAIGLQLRRAGLARERLAARPVDARRRTHELPVWALSNGWQAVMVRMSLCDGKSGPLSLPPLESVPDLQRVRAGARTHMPRSERSATPNAEGDS
jgi:hypothetical protein